MVLDHGQRINSC